MNSLVSSFKQLGIRPTVVNTASRLLAPTISSIDQVRHRGTKLVRIKGAPRPPLPFKIQPESHKYNYQPILPDTGLYTTKALPIRKLAGRDPITGRVVVNTLGGGNKKLFRWIDYKRHAPQGGTFVEKVYKVRYDPLNTFLIALVANGGHQRWIVASEYTKPGDLITTHNYIPKVPIMGKDGDTWPVGALMPGSIIHHIEVIPGEGATRCLVAGSHATIVRRAGNNIIVKLASKQEISINENCFVACGKTSNTNHYTVNLLCPQRVRWKGHRPRSGLFKKKDGYCGFKNRPPKPLKVFDTTPPVEQTTITQPIHIL